MPPKKKELHRFLRSLGRWVGPECRQDALLTLLRPLPALTNYEVRARIALNGGDFELPSELSQEAPGVFAQPSAKQQHALAHSGGQAAADEGSVEHHHLDDRPSQAQSDPPSETPGLLPAPPKTSAQSLVMAQRHTFVSAASGSPFLAGPSRQPCSAVFDGLAGVVVAHAVAQGGVPSPL